MSDAFTPPLGVPANQSTPGQPEPAPAVPASPPSTALVSLRLGDRGIQIKDSGELYRFADMALKGKMVPASYTTMGQVAIGMMMALEMGLPPLAGLRMIAVIKGTPSIWGKGSYALAMDHPLYEDHQVTWQIGEGPEMEFPPEYSPGYFNEQGEYVEGDLIPDTLRCICRAFRKGAKKPFSQKFSVADAKTAGLWMRKGKSGAEMPWSSYWSTMLYHKAVGNALEMAVPEAFIGLTNAPPEEMLRITSQQESDKVESIPDRPMTLKPSNRSAPAAAGNTTEASLKSDEPVDASFTVVSDGTAPAAPAPEGKPKKSRKSTKEEINPQDKPAPEPEPEIPETSQPEPGEESDEPTWTVNQMMKEFRESNPLHTRARMTEDNDKVRWVKCDCGAAWKVNPVGSVLTFPITHPGDGTCEPSDKPAAPEKAPFKYAPMEIPGICATHQAFLDEIKGGTKSDVAEVMSILQRKLSSTKDKTLLLEIQYLVEAACVRYLEHDRSVTGKTKVAGWINDVKTKMLPGRIEVLREFLKQIG